MLSALKEIVQDGSQLRVCYESGPYWFVTYRHLTKVSVDCMVISPSSMPRRPNDRMDAQTLAVLYSITWRHARHRAGVTRPRHRTGNRIATYSLMAGHPGRQAAAHHSCHAEAPDAISFQISYMIAFKLQSYLNPIAF